MYISMLEEREYIEKRERAQIRREVKETWFSMDIFVYISALCFLKNLSQEGIVYFCTQFSLKFSLGLESSKGSMLVRAEPVKLCQWGLPCSNGTIGKCF